MISGGNVSVELNLDYTKFEKQERKLREGSQKLAIDIERNWENLGRDSAGYYKQMADAVVAEHKRILKSDEYTTAQKSKAYFAATQTLKELNLQATQQAERSARANKANAEYQLASMKQRESSWEALGIKSKGYYDDLRAQANRAHKQLVSQEGVSRQEIERLNQAHKKRMKSIDEEYLQAHGRSFRQLNRDILAAYAGLYVIGTALGRITRFLKEGLEYSDQMKKSAIAIAATITSQKGPQNAAENYRKAYEYSTYLVNELRQIDKVSFANYEHILLMNRAMELQGVHLDVNNAKQRDAFTALTNAIAMYTGGQNQATQATEEMRSIFTGVVRPTAQVATIIDSMAEQSGKYANGLKDIVRLGKQHGNTLELIEPFLQGIVQGNEHIQETWESAVTSFETSWGRFKALTAEALFADAARDVKSFSAVLEEATMAWASHWRFIVDQVEKKFKTMMYLQKAAIDIGSLEFDKLTQDSKEFHDSLTGISKATFDFKARIQGLTEVSFSDLKKGLSEGMSYPELKNMSDEFGNIYYYYKKIVEVPSTPLEQSPEEKLATLRKEIDFRKQIADDEYQKAVRHAEKMKRLGQAQGVFEIANIEKTAKAKLAALDTYELALTEHAAEQTRLDQQQADREGKAFNFSRALWERTRAVLSEVAKRRQGILDDQEVSTEQANGKIVANYAEMYQAIDKYSMDSYRAQRAAIQTAFIEQSRFTKTSAADQAILQAALAKTLAVFDATFKKGAADERLGALSPISEASWAELEDSLEAQADLMNDAFNSQLEKEQWLTSRLSEEWAKRKSDQADYYETIEGFAQQAYEHRVEALQAQRDFEITQGQDIKAANAKYAQAVMAANEKRFDAEHAGTLKVMAATETMFSNAKARLSENSEAYKLVHNAEMAMKAAQIAIEVQKQISIATSAAQEAAVFPMKLAMRKSLALAAGVEATVSAGTGDPYTAPARMAAMAAAVSGVLALIGVGFTAFGSKGDSNYNPNTYNTGTGTLLGSKEASQSASKTLDLLKDIHAYEYSKLVGIYEEVRDLNSNITGLVKGLVMAGGDFSAMGGIGGVESFDMVSSFTTRYGRFWDDLLGTDYIESVTNKIWGGKTEVSEIGRGITIGGATMGGILDGTVATVGQFFSDMKKVVDGGWFHSDKTSYWSLFEDLDEGTNRLLAKVFMNLGSTMLELADGFGMDITETLSAYRIDIGKVNLMGKSADEVSEILTSVFSSFGDKMVETLFGSIVTQYQEINEGLLETAVRLMAEKEQIVRILEITGMAYGNTVESAIELSQSLIDLAGDMDALTDAASTYYKAFFDESERAIDQQEQLSEVMGVMGFSLPGTRRGFRDLVEGLDLATDSGRSAYVSLLQLSSMADEYYSYLEDLQEEALDSQKSLISAWQDQLSSVQDALKTWGSVTAEATLVTIEEIIARTRNGVLTASDELSAALNAATGLTTGGYETGLAYDLDQARMRASLIELESATRDQLSMEEIRLSLMERQVTSLDSLVTLATETNAILAGATTATSTGTTLTIGASNDTVVAELRELRTLIKEAGDTNRLYIKRVSDHLDDWDGAGLPEARS